MPDSVPASRFETLLHPDIAERVIRLEAASIATPAHLQTPAQVRQKFLAARQPLVRRPTSLVIRDVRAPTRDGDLAVRVYTPGAAQDRAGMVYFHGGGFTNGDLDSHDAVCVAMAEQADCVVASVDYRVMPDHPFPAAFHDAEDVVRWFHENAANHGVAPGRIGTGGDSSGANLALAAALALRQAVPLRALWLAYPIVGTDFDSPSYLENAQAPLLTRARCMRILSDYLGGGDVARADWRAAPLLAPDMNGLAPAVLISAQLDPLRSDAERLRERLARTGVSTALIEAAGMPHGFLRWIDSSDAVRRIASMSLQALRALLEVPRA